MERKMKLGDYLVAYLKKIGVSHLFGIPGDLVINLFFKFGRARALKVITLSHEPGVGFAADGYARATGRIGRSEEHTSELQSQSNLVCRLLLEKKKKIESKSST